MHELKSAVSTLMLKKQANPAGLLIEVFDGICLDSGVDLPAFFKM